MVKLSLCLIKRYIMNTYGGGNVQTHVSLTSALVASKWSSSSPGSFAPRKNSPRPDIHWLGVYVGPRADLDDLEKCKSLAISERQLRPLGHPARRQSL
jgi:hypothetical protein